MVVMILLLMMPSEESHPKIFSTSPSIIWGSTSVFFSQDSISFQTLATGEHSIKACYKVLDGSLHYLQLESVAIPISTNFLFVMVREWNSLESMYLVYASTGVFFRVS